MSRSWTWPHLLKLGLGLAVLLLILAIGASVPGLSGQYRQDARAQRSSLWWISRARMEVARLSIMLDRHLAGLAPTGDVAAQFAVLRNRVLLLDGEIQELAGADAAPLRPLLPSLLATLPGLQEALSRLVDGESAPAEQMRTTVDGLEQRLREAHLQLHLERQQTALRALAERDLQGWIVLSSSLGLLLAAGVLLALLLTEVRRACRRRADEERATLHQREAERALRRLIDSLPVMISAFDREGRYLFMNQAHARFHQVQEAMAIGRRPAELGIVIGRMERLQQALSGGAPLPFSEGRFHDKAGRQRTLLMTAAPVGESEEATQGGEPSRVVFVAFDITERKQAEDRVRHLAEHDPLTDLPNRVLFAGRLQEALARVEDARAAGQTAGIALHCIDLDRFKDVNDSLGHPVGDRLLLAAAERMRNCLRQSDTLARLGGDEFAIIQADAPTKVEAMRLANRLVRVLEAPFEIDGFTIPAGASIGCVLAPLHGRTSQTLLQQGDIALYRAKSEGRGRVVLFTPEMGADLVERRLLQSDLRQALEEDGLSLAYQPKFCTVSGRVLGCEALLRWTHPARGAIPPGRFVPLAEEAGLATMLSRWVLRQACAQVAFWQAQGLQIAVAVNLSARHFSGDQALRLVQEALQAGAIPPGLLEIEVTEDVFIRNAASARDALDSLRALGVRVALDDFGTGYSSLGYLQHLSFDVLKIDQTFMQGLRIGDSSGRIVETIIGLAHALGATVVAEGVETPEQLAVLRQLNCDAVQGFLLGAPMAPEALADMLIIRAAPLPPEAGQAA
jgi:diguanylate cyclase (GGDEF)-like protein/PAS domain S-box-containing protein